MYKNTTYKIIGQCEKCGGKIFRIKNWYGNDRIKNECSCYARNKVHPALRTIDDISTN